MRPLGRTGVRDFRAMMIAPLPFTEVKMSLAIQVMSSAIEAPSRVGSNINNLRLDFIVSRKQPVEDLRTNGPSYRQPRIGSETRHRDCSATLSRHDGLLHLIILLDEVSNSACRDTDRC